MRQQIRFCTTPDGVRIAYATSGSGPPLVRVGNWLTHLELDWESPIWAHWFEELSRGRTLVRYDPRGSGLSDRSVEDLSFDACVKDLETVVDDLGLDRFALFGLCQGGAMAVAYAARHPQRVSHLVLSGSYTRGAFADDAKPSEKQQARALTEMIRVGWGRDNAAFRKVFVELLVPEGSTEQQRWLAGMERSSASADTAARLWQSFQEIDIRELAPRVEAPTLVFHVTNDGMVPFPEGRRLASLIPDARFVPLTSKNHVLLSDEPAWQRFVEEFRHFLDEDGEEDDEPIAAEEDGFRDLTPREREVLDWMARGSSNSQIAEGLNISPKTVRNHVTRIFSKLHVTRRAEAIVRAREAGFG